MSCNFNTLKYAWCTLISNRTGISKNARASLYIVLACPWVLSLFCCLATLFLENRVPEGLDKLLLDGIAVKFSSALLPGASHSEWGYDAWHLCSVPPQGLDGTGQQEDGELWVVTWAHIQQLPSLSRLWKVALAFHCLPSGDNNPFSLAGLLGGLDEIMPASPQGRAWHNHA